MTLFLYFILFVFAIGTFAFWLYDIYLSRNSQLSKERREGRKAMRGLGIAILASVVPTILFLVSDLGELRSIARYDQVFSIILAFLISGVWIMYIRKLDIYEQESWGAILLVFVMSCITIWGVFPLSALFESFGWQLGSGFFSDLFYCIVVIGGVEELVKIIPVLIILKWRKVVNEPFDVILFGSVSALGFAFVENSMYLERYELYSLHARTFMASVAHMTFTSLVAYGLMLKRFKPEEQKYPIAVYFIAAAVAHGIYDFWLFEPLPFDTQWLTLIFFLITVHVWFKMKNNAINISNFYSPRIHLVNAVMKRRLLLSVLILLAVGTVFISLRHGSKNASEYMLKSVFYYGYFAMYLVFSIDKFKVVRGYIGGFDIAMDKLIPKAYDHHHILGLRIELFGLLPNARRERNLVYPNLPLKGVIERRVYVGDNNEIWFVLALEKPLPIDQVRQDHVLVRPADSTTDMYEDSAPVRLLLILKESIGEPAVYTKDQLAYVGRCFSAPLNDPTSDQHQ